MGRRQLGLVGSHEAGGRRRAGQVGGVAAVVEEADRVGLGAFEGRDRADLEPGDGRVDQAGARQTGQITQG